MTAVVGTEKKEYNVHEQILCANSPFFKAAFEEEWAEGRERTIPLPEDDPEVFELYQ